MIRVYLRTGVALLVIPLWGCSLLTGPGGDAADVRGSWQYTGTQSAPTLELAGTLVITQQDGESISGTASWEERDGVGPVGMDGGPVAGRAIGQSDVDFDVLLASGDRRHVGRITADTIEGAWVHISAGLSGEFRAVRTAP